MVKKISELRSKKLYKDFSITSICRADLISAGFDITGVTDENMRELASKMADAYCDNGFWIDLEIIAKERLGLKSNNNGQQE